MQYFRDKRQETRDNKYFTGYLLLAVSCLSLVAGCWSLVAEGATATLSLVPATARAIVGNNFNVSAKIASLTKAMNAVEGHISFPKDILNVVSIDRKGSIINLWLMAPDFDNDTGKIDFSGVRLNPGYLGASGQLFTITFKGVATEVADVVFDSGKVLENDGNGTMMAVNFRSGTYTIIPPTVLPRAPVVTSPTHPNQNRWYSNNSPTFNWTPPASIIGISFILDEDPTTIPDDISDGVIRTTRHIGLDEGVHYFHIKYENIVGWGPTTHFRVQVDTVNPDYFNVEEIDRLEANKARFSFSAFDSTSGIDYYEFAVGDKCAKRFTDPDGGIFETESLLNGTYILKATAYDKAGNFLVKSATFMITEGGGPPSTCDNNICEVGEASSCPQDCDGGGGGSGDGGGGGGGGGDSERETITEIINTTTTERIIKTVSQFVPRFIARVVVGGGVRAINTGYNAIREKTASAWLLLSLILVLLIIILQTNHENHFLQEENERLKNKNSYPQ